MSKPAYFTEIAQKPARQIDQVDPLIDRFSAAGEGGICAPFLLISDPPAVPVTAPDEHHFPKGAGFEQFVGLPQRGMISVIEADPHEAADPTRGLDHRFKLGA
jgi:hypothetical protein